MVDLTRPAWAGIAPLPAQAPPPPTETPSESTVTLPAAAPESTRDAPRATVRLVEAPLQAAHADGAVAHVRDTAIEDLFRVHGGSLTRLAGLLIGDRQAAEEVVQDAFVGLHRRYGDIREPERALAYLRTSVVNGSRSRLRRRRTERAYLPVYLPPAPSAEEGALLSAERQAVRQGIAKLPRRQREVIVLRYHLDLSEADIAASLGISRGAVKAYASRALAALTSHLQAGE